MNKRLPISKELRDFVLQRDEYTCRYCGSTYGPFHLDHVYPVSKGGETTANNLVTACKHCNLSKHDKVGVWPKSVDHLVIYKNNESLQEEVSKLSNKDAPTWLYFLMAVFIIIAVVVSTASLPISFGIAGTIVGFCIFGALACIFVEIGWMLR